MLITRKKQVPLHWLLYAQFPLVLTVWATYAVNAPFLLSVKRFIDNPAAITFLLSLEVYLTLLGGPFFGWLSDRVWTRYGRRKPFLVFGDVGRTICLALMPFAPDLWTLIALRWLIGIFNDVSMCTLSLTMEVVPPGQRGLAAGFKNLMFSSGNLVFSLLVIGRFHEVHFMGVFGTLGHGFSGQTILFALGALVSLLGVGYEALGIKEIRPWVARHLKDLREPGRGVVGTFARAIARDVLGRAMLPLYLLLFISAMFNLGLGMFLPLLYTEQWGYSLQQLGTNAAIGALIGMAIAMVAGVIADRTSKIKVYFSAILGGMLVKIIWVAYVLAKPGHRPELWEILVFGELGTAFGLCASLVTYPLIMDFVRRDNMGSAVAGISLFNGLIKNTLTVCMGLWMLGWSTWFLPQAGLATEVVFERPLDRTGVERLLAHASIDPGELHLAPVHRPGTDGETSRHWLIQKTDPSVQERINRRKELASRRSALAARVRAPGTDDEERIELRKQVAALVEEIAAIDRTLEADAERFKMSIVPLIADATVLEGSQVLEASWSETGRLELSLASLDVPGAQDLETLARGAGGFQHARIPDSTGEREGVPDITVESEARAGGSRILLAMRFDASFLALDRALHAAGLPQEARVEPLAKLLGAIHDQWGWEPKDLGLGAIDVSTVDGTVSLSFSLEPVQVGRKLEPSEVAALLDAVDPEARPRVESAGGGYRVTLRIAETWTRDPELRDGLEQRLLESLGDPYVAELARRSILEFQGAAEAAPVNIRLERPVFRSGHRDRRYDYFLSGYSIMIATDLLGLALIGLVVRLERRGNIRRAGVEEDLGR